jgi:hypothetical protein
MHVKLSPEISKLGARVVNSLQGIDYESSDKIRHDIIDGKYMTKQELAEGMAREVSDAGVRFDFLYTQ